MVVRFRVLGTVEALFGDVVADVGPARQRCVLAALVVQANRVVPADLLVYQAWGDDAPPGARGTLRTYLSRLRQALTKVEIDRRAGGYVLNADPRSVDLFQFHDLVARSAVGDDRLALLGEALDLWRGEAFAGLDTPWINAQRESLEAARLAAELDHTDLRLARGEHCALLPDLMQRAAARPLDERLAGQLIVALYRCGRQADALNHYERLRCRLADELGTDPSPALGDLYQKILTADSSLACTRPTATLVAAVPRQLPPTGVKLTGRDRLLEQITGALRAADTAAVLLVGPGGVGKTSLALAAAHDCAADFPDGQLYADLRGHPPGRAGAHAVAGRFLRALGVDESRLPADPGERIAMYRTHLSGKRILVMLDDAASEGQIRPLLTGTAGCATLVTSRHQLGALVTPARWTVPMLTASDAEALFTAIVGARRVAHAPRAAAAIVQLCGCLPLAVSIAAARLATRPHWTLEEFRARLAAERCRLDELSVGDLDVRAGIALSYQALEPGARLLFRRLGLVTAPTWPAWIAEPLAGDHAAQALDRLTDAHLVEPVGRDEAGQTRFRLHDLVADYAAERALADDDPAALADAMTRMLWGWLALAAVADEDLPSVPSVKAPVPAAAPAALVRQSPARWFEAERRTIVLAVEHACRLGLADIAGGLAVRLSGFLGMHSGSEDAEIVLSQAIHLVRREASPEILVHLLSALFMASLRRDRHAELPAIAAEELAQARLLADRELEVRALRHSAMAAGRLDRFGDAIDWAHQAVAAARHPDVNRILLRDALGTLAYNHWMSGDAGRALVLFEQALEIERRPLYLYHYGLVLLHNDGPGQAAAPLSEALAACHEHGLSELTGYVEQVLADVAIREGDHALAAERLGRARAVHEKIGSGDGLAEALRSTGDLAAARCDWTDAVTWLNRALRTWRGIEARVETARTLARLAHAHSATGAHDLADLARTECEAILDDVKLDRACLYLPPVYG